jgi:ketopantoate reductase
MRFVVYAAGAIGGVVGAQLHRAGNDVTLVARGPHYEAIRDRGLVLETPLVGAVAFGWAALRALHKETEELAPSGSE